MNIGSGSDTVYYKLSVEDLRLCTVSYDDDKSWSFDIGNEKILCVKFVWIQGDITELQSDSFIIRDHTGKCRVSASNAILSSNAWLTPGVYCSVLGQLQESGDSPVITAMKIANIDNNSVLRKMWPVEVNELKQFLNEKMCPTLGIY